MQKSNPPFRSVAAMMRPRPSLAETYLIEPLRALTDKSGRRSDSRS